MNDQKFATSLVEAFENRLELTLNLVQPDPEFAGRLRKRVFLKPVIMVEQHRPLARAFLIFAFGLFGGVFLVWVLKKR